MEYSLKEFSEIFNSKPTIIGKLLKKHDFKFVFKDNCKKHFFQDAFDFLDNHFPARIKIIEVPTYIPVYHEIIPSKMNFEN